jgi:uncharacterized protein YjbI with pentapeptide repeats
LVPQDSIGCSLVPQDSTGCSLVPQDSTGCSLVPHDSTGCSLVPQDSTGCSLVHQDSTGCTLVHQDLTGCSLAVGLCLNIDWLCRAVAVTLNNASTMKATLIDSCTSQQNLQKTERRTVFLTWTYSET